MPESRDDSPYPLIEMKPGADGIWVTDRVRLLVAGGEPNYRASEVEVMFTSPPCQSFAGVTMNWIEDV